MLDLLNKMKQMGLTHIRGEFEAEGMDEFDLFMLTNLARRADLKIRIKVSGLEAVSDFRKAILLGADSVVVPMVESAFAIRKVESVLDIFDKFPMNLPSVAINIESKQAVDVIDYILDTVTNKIDTVTVGRIDLASSMGYGRDKVDIIDDLVADIAREVNIRNLNFVLGGGLDKESLALIKLLTELNYISALETRKLVFKVDETTNVNKIIKNAIKFEQQYFTMKKEFLSCELERIDARLSVLKNKII